jgi:hypothetical protein
MAGCTSTDCVTVRTDQATTSLLGPTDGPTTTLWFPGDFASPVVTGGPGTFAPAGLASATGTANPATIQN